MIRVGLLGAGRIGRLHAQNLATRVAGARLAAVADVVPEAARAMGERWGVPWSADPEEVMEQVDAVAICTATDTHAALIEQAAARGRHVFCEKPIDLRLDRIDAALQAVARAGVLLQVGFNRRFDPGVRRLRQALQEGRLGRPEILRITSRDPAPPPAAYLAVCGGLFLDMAIHDLDLARCLAGEVVEVHAMGAALVEGSEVDTAVTTLRFASGALGTVDNSRRATYGYDQRVEVHGSLGMACTGNRSAHSCTVHDAAGSHGPRPYDFFLDRYAESFVAEMESFAAAVARGVEVEVTGEDGRVAVALALAAGRSLREGRPVAVR